MKKYGVSNSGSKNLVQPIHIWIVQEGLENKKLKLLQASLARGNLFEVATHSVLERIWVKCSDLSQWVSQGARGPPKESKSRWIEIFRGGAH